jgi:hypothetical protein
MPYAARLLLQALIDWAHNEYAETRETEILELHDFLVRFRDTY